MEILERLTPRQAQFVREYVTGGNAAEAARRAGYSERTAKAIAYELLTKPDLQEAIQALQAENAARWDITRKDVIEGVLEAVAMERTQGEPMAMIAGYRELARMMGFNAPEAHLVELATPGAASTVRGELGAMSDTVRLDAYSQNKRVIDFYEKQKYFNHGNVNFPDREHTFHCVEKEIISSNNIVLA